jgi:hypothetical protein
MAKGNYEHIMKQKYELPQTMAQHRIAVICFKYWQHCLKRKILNKTKIILSIA